MKYLLLLLLMSKAGIASEQFTSTDTVKLTEAQVNDYTGNRPQPKALKDATIEVQLKDGETTYNYSANQYKVVSRESSRRVKALIDRLRKMLAECEGKLAASETCAQKLSELERRVGDTTAENEQLRGQVAELQKKQQKPNRITLHAGLGPDGMIAEKNETGRLVETVQAPIVGVGYQRIVYDQISVGITAYVGISAQSETTITTLSVGYDF